MTGHALLDLLLIAVPALLISLWWTGTRVRELAVAHARRGCDAQQVQFLDQSVALTRMALDRSGPRTVLRREYAFEFTTHGEHRDGGLVTMRGQQLVRVYFPWVRDSEGNRVWVQ